ncbi:MAG: hypothetical protein JWR26_4439 [Pedosphaera sp.]|nr:hypothetical protein [Pedosphaera sp.]
MKPSPDNSSNPNPSEREPGFFNFFGGWGMGRRLLFAFACLVTLIAVFYVEENWRGKRAWENYKREWEAKGEKFDLQAFVPPPVPDEQNFAMTPFLAPLFDFNPKPLMPGQSAWRDTNALKRVQNLGENLKFQDSSSRGSWTKGQRIDFQAWALSFRGKEKSATKPAASSITRKEAAEELLKDLGEYAPVLQELQVASQRPNARFNIGYGDDYPSGILLPHLAVMKKAGLMFETKALAELELGRSDEALSDARMIVYLSGTAKAEPFLISGLVRITLVNIAMEPLWEGLADHQWSDAHLADWEEQLGKIDLLADYAATMRGERGLNNSGLDYLRKGGHMEVMSDSGAPQSVNVISIMPSGWFYQNQLTISRMYERYVFPRVDAAAHRVYSNGLVNDEAVVYANELSRGFSPYKIFARLLFPAYGNAALKFAAAQVNVDLARVACALERHRLAHGEFPQTLDSLSPQFIKAIPHDIFSGEPLKYHRTEDGKFVLYSVGWNQKDDGGEIGMTTGKNPHVFINEGDWVWPQYPAK